MAYGSQKEGVGLTLLREIREGFMEEMTSEYSLKARKSGGESKHSRQREQQIRRHGGLGEDGPFRRPIGTAGKKGIMAVETGWYHVQRGSQEAPRNKLGKRCPVTKQTKDRTQTGTQTF